MVHCFRVRPGRLLATAFAGVAFATALCGGVAFAADEPADEPTFEQVFMRLQSTPVYKDACTKTCHGSIAKTKNYTSEINFQHGYHQVYECAACHPRFPHRADATIERPTMKDCFDCHGVRHGPMGIIATGDCEACHITPKERLRPAFHTFGWEGEEHVAPSKKEFNTKCAMCHTPDTCNDCHEAEGIRWAPQKWEYDAGDGCLGCHGDAGLSKQSATGMKSFTVNGLGESAHGDLSCQDCHSDYRYDDKPAATQIWTVNAGLACAECHRTAEDGKWAKTVEEYEGSVHYEALTRNKANYDSATCSSCHGGHFIYRLDTEDAKQRMHLSAYRVCARCHDEEYGTYDDAYHGKAYKAGNADAPACWDCHGAHEVLPQADKGSLIADAKIASTCGQEGCHAGSDEQFGADAGSLIHGAKKAEDENPILKLVNKVKGR